jgi:hypothetical protein
MLYMSQARSPRRARRWAWANRPIQSLDNPVKRYLGNRSVGPGLWKRPSRWSFRRKWRLRPAF